MTEMMKAARMYGPNDIRYEEMERPTCKEDGMIINVRAVGLCGSDIRNLTTDSAPGNYPKVYGHEIVGEIVEVGEKVEGFAVGENIFVKPVVNCNQCEECRNGQGEFCSFEFDHYAIPGGFSDYYEIRPELIKYQSVIKIADDLDLRAATLAEPLS